jgi:hypothetical protein
MDFVNRSVITKRANFSATTKPVTSVKKTVKSNQRKPVRPNKLIRSGSEDSEDSEDGEAIEQPLLLRAILGRYCFSSQRYKFANT